MNLIVHFGIVLLLLSPCIPAMWKGIELQTAKALVTFPVLLSRSKSEYSGACCVSREEYYICCVITENWLVVLC